MTGLIKPNRFLPYLSKYDVSPDSKETLEPKVLFVFLPHPHTRKKKYEAKADMAGIVYVVFLMLDIIR